MACDDLIGKRVKVEGATATVVGELQKAACPQITVRKDDGTVVTITCMGKPAKEAPLTADSFWDDVMK